MIDADVLDVIAVYFFLLLKEASNKHLSENPLSI